MRMGCDGSPLPSGNRQVINSPQKSRSESTGGLGEVSVSDIA